MTARTFGVGVLGAGFIGSIHIRAYEAARAAGYPCRIVAVADENPERLSGRPAPVGNLDEGGAGEALFDPSRVRATTDPGEVLADPEVDVVSVCTRTESHVELSLAALREGKHVLVEKPVALTAAAVQKLLVAARASDRLVMPAMCMRFWPGWTWLKERVQDGSLGKVRSAVFQRITAVPRWSPEFYGDLTRSGGALFDLHVHDADFVRCTLGDPASVASAGSLEHVTTIYRYRRGPERVVAEGSWEAGPGFPFRMRYHVAFERGTAEFDLGRDPRLVLHAGKGSEPVPVEPLDGYHGEIRHFLNVLSGRAPGLEVTLEDALGVTRLLEAERRSLESGREAVLAGG